MQIQKCSACAKFNENQGKFTHFLYSIQMLIHGVCAVSCRMFTQVLAPTEGIAFEGQSHICSNQILKQF